MKRYKATGIARKAIACMLASSLAVPVGMPGIAMAQTSDELKTEYEAAMAELGSLEDALAQAEADLGKTNYELGETKANIAGLQERIAKNEVELVDARGTLSEVVAESYKQGGDVSLLELVLSSSSLDELVSRIYYANKTAERKQNAIVAVSSLQTDLENSKASLEVQKHQQEELLESQQRQFVAMEESAERQAAYVGQLSAEITEAMEAERKAATAASMAAAREILGDERVDEVVPAEVRETIGEPDEAAQAAREAKVAEAAKDDSAKAPAGEPAKEAAKEPAKEAASVVETPVVAEPAPAPEPEPESTPAPKPEPIAEPEPEPAPAQQATHEVEQDTEDDEESQDQIVSSYGGGYSAEAASVAVNAAISQVGVAYGHDNDGSNWDCNGLTHYAWSVAGVEIPYASGTYAYGQFQWLRNSGNWVTSASSLKAGDLVFFSNDGGSTCYHVAMYIGGGQIVHAVGFGYGVQITDLNYVSGFCGGGSPA